MIELEKANRQIIKDMSGLADWVLPKLASEGRIGRVWVPEEKNPSFSFICIGEFVYLFGICPKGEQAMELKEQLCKHCGQGFITPTNQRWEQWLEETFAGEFRTLSRYAMRRDRNHFSETELTKFINDLPSGITMVEMDERLFQLAQKEDWSRVFCSNLETPENLEKDGMGYVALDGDCIVSGCSANGIGQGIIQVEVATRKEYKRQGIALACSAKFILACLEQGIYPSWDADSLPSACLAEKLGYIFDREYKVYKLEIIDNIQLMGIRQLVGKGT
jgi:hypothetical protein